jgi:carboxyl-terminal processing protease
MRIIVIIALLSVSNYLFASEQSLKEKEILSMQLAVFNDYHYSEKTLSNNEITNIFYRFFGKIDAKQTLFDEATIKLIVASSLNQTKNNDKIWHFFDAFFKQYKSKSITRKVAVEKFSTNKQDYNLLETFTLPKAVNNILPKNKQAVEKRFTKSLKYSVLSGIISYAMLDSIDYTIVNDSILKFEKEVKDDLITSYKEWIDQLEVESSEIRLLMFEELLNSIATEFDPHSNYFSLSQKKEFEKQLSKEVFLFGFGIGRGNNNNTIITKIAPGGAAWNSNELHEGESF